MDGDPLNIATRFVGMLIGFFVVLFFSIGPILVGIELVHRYWR